MVYTDAGQNQMSEGFYLKSSVNAGWQYNKYKLDVGVENQILANKSKLISAWRLGLTREIQIYKQHVQAMLFYKQNQFSEFITSSNWGLLFLLNKKHFEYAIGKNFSMYTNQNSSLNENINLLYSFKYFINERTKNWNVGICFTNYDYYNIHQETNPMLAIHGNYDINNHISLRTEIWYLTSGAFNLHVNYFGSFLRTCLIWSIR